MVCATIRRAATSGLLPSALSSAIAVKNSPPEKISGENFQDLLNDDRQKCHITRKIGDPLYTTFQKIFTIIRIFLKSEAPKALYSSHSFIVSALTKV